LYPLAESLKIKWFYSLSILFIMLNTAFLMNEFYWFLLFPAALGIIMLTIFSMENMMLLIIFFTPIAVNLQDSADLNVAISVPTEPLLFGVLLLFILKLFQEGGFSGAITRHAISAAILLNLAWIGITVFTSTMPLVSLKFFLARLWFVGVFYFMGTQLFRKRANIRRMVWLYVFPLLGVIVYTWYRHRQFYMDEKSANWVMSPFYNDHTAYAAAIALFLPLMIGFSINRIYSFGTKATALFCSIILIIALVLSYSRAAWVSVAVALVVFFLYFFKVRFYVIAIGAVTLITGYFLFQTRISYMLEKNRQDASAEYAEHVKSISNVRTDASNLERLNRWNSALRMFREKPVMGWGPGTYAFKYAPFQHASEMTIISTNAGDKGNAHSEYIGPLSESGLPGSITFIVIVLAVLYRGSKLYFALDDPETKMLTLGLLLGLITYFVHGIFNNFLDTDKLSIPFWGFIGALVSLDVYRTREEGSVGRLPAAAE
jgi:O-antigen ligase